MPASNQKLLTSSAYLAILGPDFRYATTLSRTGEVDSEGVLHGDLVIRGAGGTFCAAGDITVTVALGPHVRQEL